MLKLAGALWTFLGAILALCTYFAVLAAMGGVTTVVLWSWFVEPLGVASIGLFHAMGLVLFVGYVTYRKSPEAVEIKKGNATDAARILWESLNERFFLTLFALFLGGVYNWLM